MSELRDIAEFRSSRFRPVLPDERQVNPGVYGAELAYWLCMALAEVGVVTSYPIAEDWGWFVEYTSASGAEFAVHCGNIDGSDDEWLLSLRRFRRKLFGRDKPAYEKAAPLIAGIRSLLAAEAAVTQLRWLYGKEGNGW
jgi:hypothetical protein